MRLFVIRKAALAACVLLAPISGLAQQAVTTTGGTTGYLPRFSGTATLGNSQIFDAGTTIGIGVGSSPNTSVKLDVGGGMIVRGNTIVSRVGNATSTKAYPSWGFEFFANVYDSATKAVDNPYFTLQSEPTGNNTDSPSATFNLLFANNGGAIAETGFYINPNGTLHFASAQTFPIAAGPEGPAGPQGPTGPTGLQGPAGPAGSGVVPANLTALSGQLSTNDGVAYLGATRFSYQGACVIGDVFLSVNGYGSGNALPADGRTIPIQKNTALFSLIGTNFGGNGTSDYALPDLRAFAPKGMQYSICLNGTFPSET